MNATPGKRCLSPEALLTLTAADLASLAYAVALRLGGITGDAVRRNVSRMRKADLAFFVAKFADTETMSVATDMLGKAGDA